MKRFIAFFYCALVVFAIVGGAGYCFYAKQPQFGIALFGLGTWLGLAFFDDVKLPTKNDFFK